MTARAARVQRRAPSPRISGVIASCAADLYRNLVRLMVGNLVLFGLAVAVAAGIARGGLWWLPPALLLAPAWASIAAMAITIVDEGRPSLRSSWATAFDPRVSIRITALGAAAIVAVAIAVVDTMTMQAIGGPSAALATMVAWNIAIVLVCLATVTSVLVVAHPRASIATCAVQALRALTRVPGRTCGIAFVVVLVLLASALLVVPMATAAAGFVALIVAHCVEDVEPLPRGREAA